MRCSVGPALFLGCFGRNVCANGLLPLVVRSVPGDLESGGPGSVRSTLGDPDLRSPYGFDSGLRPPLRMTRRAGKVGCRGVVHGTFFGE